MDHVRVTISDDGFSMTDRHAPDPECVGCFWGLYDAVVAWMQDGPLHDPEDGSQDDVRAAFTAFYGDVAVIAHTPRRRARRGRRRRSSPGH